MRSMLCVVMWAAAVASLGAQEQAIVAQPTTDAAAAHFQAVLQQALGALAQSGSYSVLVESQWGDASAAKAEQGGGHYQLIWQAGKYRVEVRSQASQPAELICVNDGAQVTTLFPAKKLYSQHPADSPQASVEANKMLALSLQGSAIDILLARDVARHVQTQISGLKDHGDTVLNGKKTHYFEVIWSGAKVELWFAAEGEPLLVQFRRTASVPAGMDQHQQLICTARFQWRLRQLPAEGTFALAVPPDARKVHEIYDALAGHEAAELLGKSLPKVRLATLDGEDVELVAAANKKATVLIFWATWCAASVEDLPAVHKFVTAYKDRGIAFYAINVGEQPGAVRRFTAKHPLVSSVLLDPHSKASSALRVSELPAIAVIAPDNTVRAILHGTAKQLQGELAAQLEGMMTNTASSTARRAAEARPQSK